MNVRTFALKMIKKVKDLNFKKYMRIEDNVMSTKSLTEKLMIQSQQASNTSEMFISAFFLKASE